MNKEIMYVGCFTDIDRAGLGKGGIGVFEKDDNGTWVNIQIMEQVNPSYLCFNENKTNLYAIQGAGYQMHAYAIDRKTGKLTYLNSCEGLPSNFCQVVRGQLYVSGRELEIYNLNEDGSFKERTISYLPDANIGPLKPKQHSINPHQIMFDPKQKYFTLVNHGADCLTVHEYIKETNEVKTISKMPVLEAMMPRHIAFHKDRNLAYLLLEHIGAVMSLKYDDGIFTPFEIQPTTPSDWMGLNNTTAEIQIHPNGQLLALSNRGHDSILMCRIKDDGSLEKIKYYKDEELIYISRFFTFSEDGKQLYCANIGTSGGRELYLSELGAEPGTGSITIFDVNEETGELTFTGQKIDFPAPSCLLFLNIENN